MIKNFLLIIFLLFFTLSCSQTKELTFMVGGTPNEMVFWEKIVSDFTEESGITIKLIRTATQTEHKKQAILIALRSRKKDPDVMLMDVAWIGQMAASGWLEPLIAPEVDPSPFYDRIIKLADTYNNQIIGLPVYVDGGLLYYRKDLLQKYGYAGPPVTWSELVEISLNIQKSEREKNKDFWGFVWQGAQYEGLVCTALEFFTSAGGGYLDNSLKPVIDSDENQRALSFMVDCISKYSISPPNTYTDMKEEEVRHVFQNGAALFERNWPYAWALHNDKDSKVYNKTGIAPLPHFEKGRSASTLGGWHISLSRFSDSKKEAIAFINYVTSFRIQKKMALELGWNPGRKDVYDDVELLKNNAILASLKDVFENAVPRPSVPYYSQLSTVMQKHYNNALAGNVRAEDALKKAQQEVEKIISDNVE